MQRMTKQRFAIMELLRTQDNFLSAQDVHEHLNAAGDSIGLATVYRNLQALATSGDVDVLRKEGSEIQLFRYCGEDSHHHHLVCRHCSATVEIMGDEVELWANNIAKEYGFTRVSHSLELYGLCAQCAKNESDE